MRKILIATIFTTLIGGAYANTTPDPQRAPLNPPRSMFTDPVTFEEPKIIAPYVSLRIGGSSLRIDDNNHFGGTYAAAVGARFIVAEDLAFRVEGEFTLHSFSSSIQPGGHERNPMTYMVNAYLDFLTDHRIKPYVGVGIGFTNHNRHIRAGGWQMLSAFESELAFGLYGGVGFNLTESGMLMGDIGVRYTYADMWGHSVSNMSYNAGIRFTF